MRLKTELFQRTGSYKLRGPLVKLKRLPEEERARGFVCSSAVEHAQASRSRPRFPAPGGLEPARNTVRVPRSLTGNAMNGRRGRLVFGDATE